MDESINPNLLIETNKIAVIVNGSCSNTETFLNQKINININVDLTIAVTKDNQFWEIFELYNTGYYHGGKLKMNLIGHYSNYHGYIIRERRNKYWRRKNLGNIHLTLATMLSYPYKGQLEIYMRSDSIDKGVDTMNRVGYTIVTECLDFYNASWSTILTHSWGYPDKNNTFDGIIGEVQRKRADMGTGVYARPDRITYVDYGTSMYILALIQSVEIRTMRRNVENSWSESLMCILGHLCQQGASDTPYLFSGRILIFTLSQFALLLFQLYSASVVSSLLIKPPPNIRNLQDLVHSKLGFGCEDLKYVRDLFNTTSLPVLQELKQQKLKESNYMSPSDGLALVNKGGFSYFTELNTGYPIIEKTFSNSHVCDLQTLKLIRDARVYTNFQKNSPFRKMMNVW
ncbi:ionotropic receptor 75a-like [Onthophagus taurus]|uniref:ionotropic receptor 75a-like n=1 Tax=Onthophagus taurus TaxID=166361 RepID=UPI0039BDE200